ncbi:hypothetical protein D8B26_005070 [Coccidioides posadasii str. Silveira]|uniref:Rho-GTPase-activating protein 5 n=1 Tax=Coccidioides posadasii (strain RMSCC 757 / Silveira) TaxID=443226 RepID=E9D5Q0_COCPS|nr:rho-GTPase-activating protein 5 [Coccidioides posadasii str. Silveira]QVM10409.1 hypothetical protein D8B26_005070 [Coccidioides posadasii str. Silveira]
MANSQQSFGSPSARAPPAASGAASSSSPDVPSAPSRRDLASWWKQFKRNTKKDETAPQSAGIFGVPLNVSIKYANVAISLTGDDGKSFVYGYVPIVVAKCGVFLKEKATDVEGIFRLSGSAKRIKDLQEIFNSPDRYGKGLDWTGYTVHDAANILRRYLNQLPEPIVPLDFYERFRDPLRRGHPQTQVDGEDEQSDNTAALTREEAVLTYQRLIKELPPLNRQLLLYILDLLTVFASKSDLNRMTAGNLAAIFQPGLLSHPNHDMSPQEYKLSQDVLVFLIENQDNFLFGMTGTAADEQTVKEMQEGIYAHPAKSGIRRSASNASGGADSLRKYETLRRNVSVSSKTSKQSGGNVTSPATPRSVSSFGVHRSNTVPSKRPPGLSPTAFNRSPHPSNPPTGGLSPSASPLLASRSQSRVSSIEAMNEAKNTRPDLSLDTNPPAAKADAEARPQQNVPGPIISKPVVTPNKERKLSSLFAWSSPPEDGRQPNRLRKKRRIPGSASESAQSSTQSLHDNSYDVGSSPPPLVRGLSDTDLDQSHVSTPRILTTSSLATAMTPLASQSGSEERSGPQVATESILKSTLSRTPSPSLHYVTDQSDLEHTEENTDKKEKRRSWRFHRSSRRAGEPVSLSISPPAPLGSHAGAGFSTSSLASSNIHNQIMANDTTRVNKESSTSTLLSQSSDVVSGTSVTSPPVTKDNGDEERKSFFSKFKAKVSHVKDGMKDKESDLGRSQSPPTSDHERSSSRTSLSFFNRDAKANRAPPADATRDQRHSEAQDKPTAPTTMSPPSSLPPGPSQIQIASPPSTMPQDPTTPDVVTVLPKVEEEPSLPDTITDQGVESKQPCHPPTQAPVQESTQDTPEVPTGDTPLPLDPVKATSEVPLESPSQGVTGTSGEVAPEQHINVQIESSVEAPTGESAELVSKQTTEAPAEAPPKCSTAAPTQSTAETKMELPSTTPTRIPIETSLERSTDVPTQPTTEGKTRVSSTMTTELPMEKLPEPSTDAPLQPPARVLAEVAAKIALRDASNQATSIQAAPPQSQDESETKTQPETKSQPGSS